MPEMQASSSSSHTQTHPARPPFMRNNTVPLYVRTTLSDGQSSSSQDPQPPLTANQLSSNNSRQALFKDQTVGASSSSKSSLASVRNAHWQLPPTPPLSTSPGSAESYDSYFPPQSPASSFSSQGPISASSSISGFSSRSGQGATANTFAPPVSVTSPTVSSSPAFQLLRSTRAPVTQSSSAHMKIETNPSEYVLSATIGPGFDSSCITIAMRKNNILDIVADRWNLEKDCHHEWQVQFDRDADMNGVHASYANGVLTVTVKRLGNVSTRPPQMRP